MANALNDVLQVPQQSFKIDGVTYYVRKEKPRIERDDPYWLRCVVSGRSIHRSMKTNDARVAVDRARPIVLAARRGNWDGVFENRETATTMRTVADMIEAMRVTFAHLQPRTFTSYASTVRIVVRAGLGVEDANSAPLSGLTPAAARRFFTSYIPPGAEGQALKQARHTASRTGASVSRQCRALFAPAAMERYQQAGIRIPGSVMEFVAELGRLRWPSSRSAYERPSDEVIARTIAAIPALEESNLPAALAVELALGLGLRRAEIAQARWEYFEEQSGRPYYASETLGKGGEKIRLPVLPDAWDRLKRFRQAEGFVIPAACKTDRVNSVFDDVGLWMRSLGWGTKKMIHELRKYVGSKVCEKYDLTTASLFLRHKNQQTTQQAYMKYLKLKDIELDLGMNTQAAQVNSESNA
jgi:integrase